MKKVGAIKSQKLKWNSIKHLKCRLADWRIREGTNLQLYATDCQKQL